MKPDRKIDPEKIHLLSLRTVKGNIDATDDVNQDHITGHSFTFEANAGMDLSKEVIGLMLTVHIDAMDAEEKLLGISGSYTHEIVFNVESLKDFLDENIKEGRKEYIIDGMLLSTLFGIAYSTVRGIIFSRTQGTSLGTVIIPVMDPKKLSGLPIVNKQTADS